MNLANFRLVLESIKANPQKFDQGTWCGSAYCLAGHAYALSKGGEPPTLEMDKKGLVVETCAIDFLQLRRVEFYEETDSHHWLFHWTRTLEDFERVARGEIDEHGNEMDSKSKQEKPFRDGHEDFEDDMKMTSPDLSPVQLPPLPLWLIERYPRKHQAAVQAYALEAVSEAIAPLERANASLCNQLRIAGQNLILAEGERNMAEATKDKEAAYLERNQVVAALAKLFPSGTARTAIEDWDPEWHGCVYIDLPTGQVSWHYHDSQAYLFADLPPYKGMWDGHDTPEKYRRLAAMAEAIKVPSATSDEEVDAVIESLGWQINMSPRPRTEAITLIQRLRAENARLTDSGLPAVVTSWRKRAEAAERKLHMSDLNYDAQEKLLAKAERRVEELEHEIARLMRTLGTNAA